MFHYLQKIDIILARLDAILAILKPHSHPTRIALELPLVIRKGQVMPNYELKNDTIATITIKTVNAGGVAEPLPTGDIFTALSGDTASLGAAIGADASGAPALILTPLVQSAANVLVTVSDSSGLTAATQIVDIVADNSPKNIVLDLADAVLTPQPVPAH